jgi:hypothetical protein
MSAEVSQCEHVIKKYGGQMVTNLFKEMKWPISKNVTENCKKIFSLASATWLQECKDYVRTLPKDQKRAIVKYTNHGVLSLTPDEHKHLQDVINNAPRTDKEITVYRGFHKDWDTPFIHNFKKIPYLSTTLWKTVAADFGFDPYQKGHENIILELVLPIGTACLWIDPYSEYKEQEVLIPDIEIEIHDTRTEKVSFLRAFDDFTKQFETFTILRAYPKTIISNVVNLVTGKHPVVTSTTEVPKIVAQKARKKSTPGKLNAVMKKREKVKDDYGKTISRKSKSTKKSKKTTKKSSSKTKKTTKRTTKKKPTGKKKSKPRKTTKKKTSKSRKTTKKKTSKPRKTTKKTKRTTAKH